MRENQHITSNITNLVEIETLQSERPLQLTGGVSLGVSPVLHTSTHQHPGIEPVNVDLHPHVCALS